jgi:archaellum biogenesis ATPase FlaH
MNSNKNMVLEDLSKAGEASVITPLLMELDKLRIVSTSDIQDEEFLFNIKGKPCMPRKDLTVITGQAKTGKTVLISILMACCARRQEQGGLLGIERIREQPLKVMWVDTEQNPQSTQYILKKRVMRLVDGEFPDDLFFVFNLRSASIGERYDLIAEGVQAYKPDILIVDNVRDLISDINNGEKAQELIEGFMKLSQEHSCNVVTVIHQNRSAENRGLRGWLGTELTNKAFEVYACQKFRQKNAERPTFCIEQSMTRKFDIDSPVYYQMDGSGLPVAADVSGNSGDSEFPNYGKASVETMNRTYIIKHPDDPDCPWEWDFRKLFENVMGGRSVMGYPDFEKAAMTEAGIQRQTYFKKIFAIAEEQRVVRKTNDRCGRVVVMLIPL